VSVLQPMQGGCGGRPSKDGIDGVNFSAGSLRNVPTEAIELEAPVFIERYMLADRAAPGEYRGGAGVVFEFRCLAADAIVTARGMDRFRLRPYGRKGGGAGTLGNTVINPGSETERQIGKIDILKLQPDDTVRIVAPGGGGYGDPLRRDPTKVLADVENGFVTAEEADSVYGVVMRAGAVDEKATAALRASRSGRQIVEFVFGDERLAYEAVFSPQLQDRVAALLSERPAAVRQYARGRIYEAIERDPALRQMPPAKFDAEIRAMLDRLLATTRAEAHAWM
ncbi:MAG TPA: hydantoinase B/oxoprolinase family protein, partial [Stellaceae bacterium]|nr:hydantoinase B/oxoprolinase family protein [Stellaceae bacterium]